MRKKQPQVVNHAIEESKMKSNVLVLNKIYYIRISYLLHYYYYYLLLFLYLVCI